MSQSIESTEQPRDTDQIVCVLTVTASRGLSVHLTVLCPTVIVPVTIPVTIPVSTTVTTSLAQLICHTNVNNRSSVTFNHKTVAQAIIIHMAEHALRHSDFYSYNKYNNTTMVHLMTFITYMDQQATYFFSIALHHDRFTTFHRKQDLIFYRSCLKLNAECTENKLQVHSTRCWTYGINDNQHDRPDRTNKQLAIPKQP